MFDLLPYSDEDAVAAAGQLDKTITSSVGARPTEGCPEFTAASKANDLSTIDGQFLSPLLSVCVQSLLLSINTHSSHSFFFWPMICH